MEKFIIQKHLLNIKNSKGVCMVGMINQDILNQIELDARKT